VNKIQAIRGMNDVLPEQTSRWQYLETVARALMDAHGYREIRFPVLEQTQLFKRSIGEVTDIVEKEMYTFLDRNGDSLSLRPEGTACCVRAAEQHGLLYNQTQKLWYMGPMYRHERPQKGRYRQFHQLGVETFGMAGSDIEGELLLMCASLWKKLGLDGVIQLQLNNLGAAQDRVRFAQDLRAWLLPRRDQLDADSQRRLDSNVLRILDSKDPDTQLLLQDAPRLNQYLGDDPKRQFDELLQLLEKAAVHYTVNPALVRGLDYYNGMVFEWVTDKLGAQATVCAGGRYDGLSRQLGGADTPAVGFAMGLERLLLLLEATDRIPEHLDKQVDVYLAVVGEGVRSQALLLARELRERLPNMRILTHCGSGKYNAQLKKAYASGASCAIVLEGDEEQLQAKVKVLEDEGETLQLDLSALAGWLDGFFKARTE
jgi:histidyl-tRNA synthetase